MDAVILPKPILDALTKEVSMLSETDIRKVEKGTHHLSVNLVKNRFAQARDTKLSETQMVDLLANLQTCKSREQGHELIIGVLKNKKELEQFARYLDILILKQDKVEQIKEKIIEATVGAMLRSNAIQGKNNASP